MSFAVATIARTTEVGSRVLVHAVQPDVGERTHGAFVMDCKVRRYVLRTCHSQYQSDVHKLT